MSPTDPSAGTSGQNNWVKSNLSAIATAAVLTVYAAGFFRTREAAARFAEEDVAERRPASPRHAATGPHPSGRTTPRDGDGTLPATLPSSVVSAAAAANNKEQLSTGPAVGAPAPAPTVAAQKPVASAPTVSAGAPNNAAPVANRTATAPATAPMTVASAAPATGSAPATPTPAAVVAAAPAPAPAPPAAAKNAAADSAAAAARDNAPLKDGLFFGWGMSRHGDIQAAIEVKDGKILSAYITACMTQYSCSWIEALPEQVVQRQSAETDYVTGATQSSNAFYGAIVQALKKAR